MFYVSNYFPDSYYFIYWYLHVYLPCKSNIDFHAINQLNDKDVILGIATYMNYDSVMLRCSTIVELMHLTNLHNYLDKSYDYFCRWIY